MAQELTETEKAEEAYQKFLAERAYREFAESRPSHPGAQFTTDVQSGEIAGTIGERVQQSILDWMQEHGIETGGAIAGSLAGGALLSPLGPPGILAGGTMGAGLFGGAGAVVNKEIQDQFTHPINTEMGRHERFGEFARAGGEQAGGEALIGAGGLAVRGAKTFLGGRPATTALEKIQDFKRMVQGKRPLSQGRLVPTMTEEGRAAVSAIDELNRYYPNLPEAKIPLSNMTKNRLVDLGHNWSEGGVFGGQISNASELVSERILKRLRDHATEIAEVPTTRELGTVIRQVVDEQLDLFQSAARGVRQDISKVVPADLMVNTARITKVAKSVLPKDDAFFQMVTGYRQTSKPIPYGTAHEMMKIVEEQIAQGKNYGTLLAEFDKSFMEALKTVDSELAKSYAWSLKPQTKPYIQALMRRGYENPSGLARQLLKDFRENPEFMKQLKSQIGAEPEWDQFRAYVFEDVVSESVLKTGVLDGAKLYSFAKAIGRTETKGLGNEVLRELFSPEEIADLLKWSKTLMTIQEKQAGGVGRMAVQLQQQRVAANPLEKAGEFVTLGLGPPAIGKIWLNDTARNLFMRGSLLPRDHPAVRQIMARLTAYLADFDAAQERARLGTNAEQPSFGLMPSHEPTGFTPGSIPQ